MLQAFNQNHQHLHHLHHQTTKANSWTLVKTTSGFFLFGIHNNMFLNIVKKKFWKKTKNANVTSDHQAIINIYIIIII